LIKAQVKPQPSEESESEDDELNTPMTLMRIMKMEYIKDLNKRFHANQKLSFATDDDKFDPIESY
jgi:L-2-hydroxyglutarate oxidase LhgO